MTSGMRLAVEITDGEAVSTDWGAVAGAAGFAAVVDSWGSSGADAHAGEEWVAALGVESGVAAEAAVVERAGTAFTERVAATSVGQPAAGRLNLKMLEQQIQSLDAAVIEAAEKNAQARLLMTQPGVGPITSLAFVLTLGEVSRFRRSKQVASYLGLIPRAYSSGGHQRLGSISKQGNRFMRTVVVEAAQNAVRCDPQMRSEYLHRCHPKAKGVAKVAAARKLAIRLYWMLRTQKQYPEIVSIESRSRVPLVSAS
jgi:hypothetical protein